MSKVVKEKIDKLQTADDVVRELKRVSESGKVSTLSRFFKTGKGEYGEGDLFLGVIVPKTRAVAKRAIELKAAEIKKLSKSPYHEARLVAVLILTMRVQNKKVTGDEIQECFDLYLQIKKGINNWDLIDVSAPHVVGAYLGLQSQSNVRAILRPLSQSKSMWERRIAILSTFYFIRKGNLDWIYELSDRHYRDPEDLMHKAVGWMLREAGKKDPARLRAYVEKIKCDAPRTLLRYAIEKFPKKERDQILLSSKIEGH